MKQSEFYIGHYIDEPPVDGSVVDPWRRHVTVIPPFLQSEDVSFDNTLQGCHLDGDIVLSPGGSDRFGGWDVVLLDDYEDRLRRLHFELANSLRGLGVTFTDTSWMFDNYTPHSTVVEGQSLEESFIVDSLSLNRKHLGQMTVLRTVRL